MNLPCPTCSANELRATTLTEGLPAQSCPECRGAVLPLIAYRDWRTPHRTKRSSMPVMPAAPRPMTVRRCCTARSARAS